MSAFIRNEKFELHGVSFWIGYLILFWVYHKKNLKQLLIILQQEYIQIKWEKELHLKLKQGIFSNFYRQKQNYFEALKLNFDILKYGLLNKILLDIS